MERLVKGRLIRHLEMNNLIGDSQNGFPNKRNCMTKVARFPCISHSTYDTDNNKAVDLVYMDFQKAFDKVPHERLMLKAKHMAFKVMQPDGSETGYLVVTNWYGSTKPKVTGHQSHLVYHKVVYQAPTIYFIYK